MSKNKKILCGVTGGIAAYKAADLVSKLTRQSYSVHVVMTDHAREFVGPATFRALSGNPVVTSLFAPAEELIPHISLSEDVDLCIIAPATANIIGKIANGIADDILTTSILACSAPKLIVPSMNTQMWDNPLVQENISKLKKLGYIFVEPDYGRLACGTEGKGRYPENEKIIAEITKIMHKQNSQLAGKKIIITSGGTREAIDPVRVITNNSSGKMGLALYKAAVDSGADVEFIQATNTAQLKNDIAQKFAEADILIMAAAVSDYKPKQLSPVKIKSHADNLTIELEKNEDILSYFGSQKKNQYLVGFCLETNDLKENAQKKLKNKNLDLIVANSAEAIGADEASVLILDKQDNIEEYCNLDKSVIAEKILERICRDLDQ